MIIDKYTRYFLQFDFVPRAARNNGQPLSLITDDDEADIISVLKQSIENGDASIVLKDRDTVELITIDVRRRENVAVFFYLEDETQTPPRPYSKTSKLRSFASQKN